MGQYNQASTLCNLTSRLAVVIALKNNLLIKYSLQRKNFITHFISLVNISFSNLIERRFLLLMSSNRDNQIVPNV